MKKIDLAKYGITGVKEIVHNPSYEELFKEETDPALEGYEKGQRTRRCKRHDGYLYRSFAKR